MHGGSNRGALPQNMYPSSLPHNSMYGPVVPGMQQRMHPIVTSLQLGNGGYPEFYKLPYPSVLAQNGNIYNQQRIPAGGVPCQKSRICSGLLVLLACSQAFYLPS